MRRYTRHCAHSLEADMLWRLTTELCMPWDGLQDQAAQQHWHNQQAWGKS